MSRAIVTLVAVALLAPLARADVVVLANRTPQRIPIDVRSGGPQAWTVTLAVGESRPIFTDGPVEVAFDSRAGIKNYTLDTSSVYFLGSRASGALDLQKIAFGDPSKSHPAAALPGAAATTPAAVIPVKILVDEEELARQYLWEPRLRKRIEAASAILHRHAMVKLQVVAVDRWESDDATKGFNQSLAEFEREVDPGPAKLAIGFSSQYQIPTGRVHLGGTHGPLKPHILMREWSRHVSETEKLELLLHELGHYLGAAHSPEDDSVMRPVLGDRKSRRTDFVVRFDPVNTLLISMVGEEIRRRRVSSFSQLTSATKSRLNDVYQVMGAVQADDNSSRVLTGQLGARQRDPLAAAAQRVLAELTRVAKLHSQLNAKDQLAGDDLLEVYVRLAAETASETPDELKTKAFLLGLGIAVGDPEQLKQLPALRSLIARIDSPADRSVRQTYMGKPTIQGRNDLARHFTVAAMLVASSGAETAETLSLAKEALDSQGGTGFSFADLAADKAGIAMAKKLLGGQLSLSTLAGGFRTADYIPPVADLPEGMTTMQFIQQYGGQQDERYQQLVKEIEAEIEALPAYSKQ